jgi:hypothetical protein
MNSSRDRNLRAWILVIGVLVILSLVATGIVFAIYESARRAQEAIQPVSELTSNLSTQVAQALHPTPTILPDPVSIIHEVRALARLETIQYSVEKVITAETGQGVFGFLVGDRLLFVAHGLVIAGVDLEKLAPEDMQVKEGILYVRLPEAEVFVATLDNDKSYVYDREIGFLTKGDIHLETAARRVAEDEIAKSALDDGIIDHARQNAESYLYRFFISLGYPEVIFVKPTPESQ